VTTIMDVYEAVTSRRAVGGFTDEPGLEGGAGAARTAFDAQMVQIGVSILSADPSKSDIAPAREWAIALVEKHSGQEFSGEDRGNLWLHPIQTARSLGSMDFKREADEGERPILNRSIC